MKSLALGLSLLAGTLAPLHSAQAHRHSACSRDLHVSGIEEPARWAPRRDSREARVVMTSRDGDVSLLLFRNAVTLQLSDRTMRRVESKLDAERHDGDADSPLGEVIEAAVLASVSVVLKHSAECPLSELRDAEVRDGRLVFWSRDGERVFDGVEMNDHDVLASFRESDARLFVGEFRRLKAANH